MSATPQSGWDIIAAWLIDVSKYLITAVVIATVVKDIENKFLLYAASIPLCAIMLAWGIYIKTKRTNRI